MTTGWRCVPAGLRRVDVCCACACAYPRPDGRLQKLACVLCRGQVCRNEMKTSRWDIVLASGVTVLRPVFIMCVVGLTGMAGFGHGGFWEWRGATGGKVADARGEVFIYMNAYSFLCLLLRALVVFDNCLLLACFEEACGRSDCTEEGGGIWARTYFASDITVIAFFPCCCSPGGGNQETGGALVWEPCCSRDVANHLLLIPP